MRMTMHLIFSKVKSVGLFESFVQFSSPCKPSKSMKLVGGKNVNEHVHSLWSFEFFFDLRCLITDVLWPMSAAWCLKSDAQCLMFDVPCPMSEIRCLMFDVWFLITMFDVRCKMSNVRCLMSDVWSSMFDVRCLIFDVRCLMSDVWCLTFDIRCLMSDDTVRSIVSFSANHLIKNLCFTLIKKLDSTSSSCQLSVLWIRFWKIWTKIENTKTVD